MPANATTRHAVCRSTGATTLARKQVDGSWNIECLNHGATTTAPNRGGAWKLAPKPEGWCPKCKAVAAGKAEKIEDGLLDIPAPTGKKAAPKKPASKATAKKATA
jgi:hypothetical protein